MLGAIAEDGGKVVRKIGDTPGGVPVLTSNRDAPLMLPSTYIGLTVFAPIKNSLPGLMTTLPWMNEPIAVGVLTLVMVFSRELKFSSKTLLPVPVPLGGWLTKPEVPADRELSSVRERDGAADVQQIEVAADENARSGAAQARRR